MKDQPFKNPATYIAATLLAVLAILMALGSPSPILASEPDSKEPSKPIRITADKLVTDTQAQTAQFIGNVHAVQGDTQIKADRLIVHYQSDADAKASKDSGAIKRITAHGHVTITFDNRLAVSEQAVYITTERKLILKGPGSKVMSGQDEIVGSKITYSRDSGRITIEGDDQNQVEALFHTDQKDLN